jgi:hypothetical protein
LAENVMRFKLFHGARLVAAGAISSLSAPFP